MYAFTVYSICVWRGPLSSSDIEKKNSVGFHLQATEHWLHIIVHDGQMFSLIIKDFQRI